MLLSPRFPFSKAAVKMQCPVAVLVPHKLLIYDFKLWYRHPDNHIMIRSTCPNEDPI